MQITVKLYGTLRRHRPSSAGGSPHHSFAVSLPDGATLSHLTELLGIASGFVSAVAVNGEAVTEDITFNEGDAVSLFPPAAGG